MEIPLDDPNDAAWPPDYRKGTVEGVFLNTAGQVQLDEHNLVIEPAARMIESVPDSAAMVHELREKLAAASWSPTFARSWRGALTVIGQNASRLTDPEAQREWLGIITDLQRAGASLEE